MAYKMTKTTAPAAPAMYKLEANRLYGIDATTSDDNVSLSRACGISYFDTEQNSGAPAPGIMNMIRTNVGEIGKRRGAENVEIEDDGEYTLKTVQVFDVIYRDNCMIRITNDAAYSTTHTSFYYAIHTYKYTDGKYIHTAYNTDISSEGYTQYCSCCLAERRVIVLFNTVLLTFNIDDCTDVKLINPKQTGSFDTWQESGVKIPTIYIGGTPAGGSGKGYEPINILCPWVYETFQGDGSSTQYHLAAAADTGNSALAEVKNESGEYVQVKIATVTDEGIFKFDTAPGKPVITGEDNVRILYPLANIPDASKICGCTVSCNFGVSGYKDRLFLSGNSSYPNYVFYSAMDDYLYFSETSYLTFADKTCTVKALAGQDTSLAVITDNRCYLVSGAVNTATDSDYSPDALFTVSHTFESAKPADNCTPLVFNNEIIYMSEHGLTALTPSNVMDERYIQLRSERLNYWLLKEDLSALRCCVCGDFFVVSNRAGRMYLLDGAVFSSTESKPFSYRQYEGYIWDSLAAEYIWSHNGDLYFTPDIANPAIYHIPFDGAVENSDYVDCNYDEPQKISAYFETPNIFGSDFYSRKSFAKLGVLLRKMIDSEDRKEINTSVRIWVKKNNDDWKLLKDYDGNQSIFRYDYLNYGLFTYRPAGKKYTIDKKIKLKKTYNLKLRFENDIEGMPFFLQAFGLEYTK